MLPQVEHRKTPRDMHTHSGPGREQSAHSLLPGWSRIWRMAGSLILEGAAFCLADALVRFTWASMRRSMLLRMRRIHSKRSALVSVEKMTFFLRGTVTRISKQLERSITAEQRTVQEMTLVSSWGADPGVGDLWMYKESPLRSSFWRTHSWVLLERFSTWPTKSTSVSTRPEE